jgi:nucleoside 2-deoxyribosyltransferase
MRQLRCFIASAFDKKDVDIIFTKVVQPVLRQRNITPIRVDRVEHNDDIDDKILELIDDCDFCIADLTYARPSVYYEAGRVHGMGKPVIFLTRLDHFNPKKNDLFGNFRIHFDLQMKNIIKWTEPTATLEERLGSRVNIVVKPLLKSLCENEKQKQAQAFFSMLPQKEKLLTIAQFIKSELKKMKFTLEKKKERNWWWSETNILGIKKMDQASVLVWYMAQPSFTKSRLIAIRDVSTYSSDSVSDFFKSMKVDTKKKITLHILCCSLRPTPESRIADVFPHFCPHEQFKVYSYLHESGSHTTFNNRHIHFLERIDSVLAIQDQLKKHLSLIGRLDD